MKIVRKYHSDFKLTYGEGEGDRKAGSVEWEPEKGILAFHISCGYAWIQL